MICCTPVEFILLRQKIDLSEKNSIQGSFIVKLGRYLKLIFFLVADYFPQFIEKKAKIMKVNLKEIKKSLKCGHATAWRSLKLDLKKKTEIQWGDFFL